MVAGGIYVSVSLPELSELRATGRRSEGEGRQEYPRRLGVKILFSLQCTWFHYQTLEHKGKTRCHLINRLPCDDLGVTPTKGAMC